MSISTLERSLPLAAKKPVSRLLRREGSTRGAAAPGRAFAMSWFLTLRLLPVPFIAVSCASDSDFGIESVDTPLRVASHGERLFPEWARRSTLANGALEYSFEECAEVPTAELSRYTQVSFDQLGSLGGVLNRRVGQTTCATSACYLRVSTAELESELTIGSAGTVPCEDPSSRGLGTCALGYSTAAPASDLRGHIVTANRIRVTHEINPGPLSLVLIAKDEIVFEPGAGIRSYQTSAASAPRVAAVPSQGAPGCRCVAWTGLYNPYEPDSRRCTRLDCGTYSTYHQAAPGQPGQDAGSVVLIAPRITFRTSGSASFIRLDGQNGGSGGSYNGPITCGRGINAFLEDYTYHTVNNVCIEHAQRNAKAPGRGGNGGSAGKLILVANTVDMPAQVAISHRGGSAGSAGSRTTIVDFTGRSYGYAGSAAPSATWGLSGWRDDLALRDQYNDYAFFLVKRGSERLLSNARFYARYIHGATGPGDTHRQIAIGEVSALIDQFCGPWLSVPVRTERRASGAPSTYLPGGAGTPRETLCNEAESLLLRLESDLNLFGLEEDFRMYLRPDVMADYREAILGEVDRVKGLFDQAAANTSVAITEIENLEDFALVEQRMALSIAEARFRHLGEVVAGTLGEIELNNQQMEEIGHLITRKQNEVTQQLAPASCNFFCYFSRLVSLAGTIANFATNVASALNGLVDFFSNLGPLFDLGRITSTLSDGNAIDFGQDPLDDIKVLVDYGKAVFEGTEIGGKKVPGIGKIGKNVAAAIKDWKEIDATFSGQPTIAQQWNRITYSTERLQRDLREAMGSVQEGIANVELSLSGSSVVDRNGALANLRLMLQLLEQRLFHANRMSELQHAHLVATGEMLLADLERELAETKVRNLETRTRNINCRLGLISCPDIPPRDSVAARRDALCIAGSSISELALLFDFFYRRSSDFVTLQQCAGCGPGADRSHDFQRNLLRDADRVAFSSATTNPLLQEFLNRLTPSSSVDERLEETICLPGADCGGGVVPVARSYQQQVMSHLLKDGRATFDLAEECRPGEPWSYCSAALFAPIERPRQRVTFFDAALRMRPGYRLGCAGASCTGTDVPLNGMRFRIAYRHDDVATFRWDDGSLRDFLFPEDYPFRACELVRGLAGGPVDCRQIMDFNGTSDHGAPSTHKLREPPPWTESGYSGRETLFGTSVRGTWHLDIGDTLAQLNGGAGDACYDFHSGNPQRRPFPSACLPAECLSPCFDDAGARLPSSAPGVPAFCGCYDAGNVLSQAMSSQPECQGRPSALTFVRNDSDLPSYCEPTPSGSLPQEDACRRFVTPSGGFFPNGDQLCCNADGRFRGNLSAATAATCRARGFVNDESCSAPDICREICGPRCKEFKRSLLGVQFRIYWRSDGSVGEVPPNPGEGEDAGTGSGDPPAELPRCQSGGLDQDCVCEGGRIAGRDPTCEYCYDGDCFD